MVHIYHGDGKGKTTCAIGLSIRALGAGYRVIFAQFLKNDDSSELKILKELEAVTTIVSDKTFGFTWTLSQEELGELRMENTRLLQQVKDECSDTQGSILVVLDEMCATYELDLVDRELVLDFLKQNSQKIEIVLTGRNPAKELIELADYLSEINKQAHPMDRGVDARIGIEQ